MCFGQNSKTTTTAAATTTTKHKLKHKIPYQSQYLNPEPLDLDHLDDNY